MSVCLISFLVFYQLKSIFGVFIFISPFILKPEKKMMCSLLSPHLNICFSVCFLSVLFQSSEEKRGVFDRLSSFFNKRKKSSSRHHSDASNDERSPTSPLSPRSPQFEDEEDGEKTPTPSRKASELPLYGEANTGAEQGNARSQCSSPSASSTVSLLTDDADLPFADSNSSGRSSVREINVCRISTASSERNSGNVTPDTRKPASTTQPSADSGTEIGFAESVVEEVNKKLQVNLEERIQTNAKASTKDSTVTSSTTRKIPLPKTAEGPKSPNLTSISLASKKSSVKVGERGHSTALTGIRLGSQSSTSKEEGESVDKGKERSRDRRRGQIFLETKPMAWDHSCESGEVARRDSPVRLHKAIWVETHMGEEEKVVREGENERDAMTEREEGFRADSPPVLAIPVTVIPEDEFHLSGRCRRPLRDVAAQWQPARTCHLLERGVPNKLAAT